MAKFRKKPVEVEAVQWTGENHREMFDFLTWNQWDKKYMTASGDHFYIDHSEVKGGLVIKSGHRNVPAKIGDYIIKNEQGEFFVHASHFFESVYELVDKQKSKEQREKEEAQEWGRKLMKNAGPRD